MMYLMSSIQQDYLHDSMFVILRRETTVKDWLNLVPKTKC